MTNPESTSPSKNVDALIADISKLMAEAEGMLSESSSHAEEHTELFRERREALDPSLSTRYAETRAKVAEVSRRADRAIRTFPYEAATLALGVGVLLGACMSRRRPALPSGG